MLTAGQKLAYSIPTCGTLVAIDKLYTQIGNVNRLHNIIEPFAALFWALGIVLAHILQ